MVTLVVAAGTLAALSGPGQTAGVSALVDPMVAELGVGRAQVSLAYLIGTLVGAGLLPWVGRAVDRYGVRPVLAGIAVCFGVFLAVLATARGMVGLTVGFAGVRAAGQGALTMCATTAVALWVTARRGIALGVTSALGAAGISLFPLVVERLVAAHGWRTTVLAEALVVPALVLAVTWLALRPTRSAVAASGGRQGDGSSTVSWTPRQAAGTAMFWLLTAGICLSGLLTTAVAFHQISLLGEQGLSPTAAAANFLPQTAAGLLASLAAGAAADRVPARVLVGVAMATQAAALLALPAVRPGLAAVGYGAALGTSASIVRVVEAAALARYFGTAHLGAIRGTVHAAAVAATAFGPLLLSVGRDLAGSYRPVVAGAAVLPAALAVVSLFVRSPASRTLTSGQPT